MAGLFESAFGMQLHCAACVQFSSMNYNTLMFFCFIGKVIVSNDGI